MKLSDFGFNLATIKLVTLTSAGRGVRENLADATISGKIVIINYKAITGRTALDLEAFLEGAIRKRGDFIKIDEGVLMLVPKSIHVEFDDQHIENDDMNEDF